MRYLPFAAALALALAAVPAQETFRARQFLPNDYHNVVHINLAQMRETGIWDELNVGLIKVANDQLAKEAGFELDSLDRLTMVPQATKADREEGMSPRDEQVLVLEGNTELAVPARVSGGNYSDETIGDFEVKRRSQWRDEVFFRPRPEVQIYGSTGLLRPMLEGKPSPGMPCADIMSLMAGHDDALLYFVIHLADEALNDRVLKMLFPDSEWPADDRPQYMMLHLSAIGDPDDPHIEVEAVLRHQKVGGGMAVTGKAVDGLIEKAGKEPHLRLVAPLLKEAVRTQDRTDLSLKLDLGRARTAAGRIAMIVLPMMTMGGEVQAAEAIEIVEEEVEEPPPPPEPAKKKGGGGEDR